MGNIECCSAKELEQQIQIERGQALQEKIFLQKYQKIDKILKTETFPVYQINKELISEFKGEGTFLGKKDLKLRDNIKGVMLYNEGLYYVGDWKTDQRHGLGIMIDKQGDFYKGEWNRGQPHGYGEYYTFDKQRIYKGKWKQGIIQGLGEELYPGDIKFVGDYIQGKKQGRGQVKFPDGCYFQGQFKDDKITGNGSQKGLDYIFEGKWQNNQMNGPGKSTYYIDGSLAVEMYIGQFKDGLKHGYGEYRWADGRVYKGEWENGEMKSRGVFINRK